ncbi:MAG: hypothetical protein M1374_04220 [Firmicutes bacterium]|nr:hypothetical protein [Bacillota bacterium]
MALIVALLIGEVTNDVLNSSTSYAKISDKSYMAALVPIFSDSNVIGQEIANWRSVSLKHSAPAVLESEISNWVKNGQSDIVKLNDIGISPPDALAGNKLSAVLSLREQAILDMQKAFDSSSASQVLSVQATGYFVAAGKEIRLSSTLLKEAVKSFKKAHINYDQLPSNSWEAPLDKWDAQPIKNWLSVLAVSASSTQLGNSLVISDISTYPLPVNILGISTTTLPTTTLSITTTSSTTTTSTTTTTTSSTTTTLVSGSSTTTTTIGGKKSAKSSHSKQSKKKINTATTTTLFAQTLTSQIPPSNSTSLLPPVSSLVVKVVVTNQSGEEIQKPILTLTISGQSPGKTSRSLPKSLNSTKEIKLAPIPASQSVYKTWKFHHLHLGGSYKLIVEISAPGFQSNSKQVMLKVAPS